jgi:hypothetical protein
LAGADDIAEAEADAEPEAFLVAFFEAAEAAAEADAGAEAIADAEADADADGLAIAEAAIREIASAVRILDILVSFYQRLMSIQLNLHP